MLTFKITLPSLFRFLLISIVVCLPAFTAMAQSTANDDERQPDFPGLDIQAIIGWDGRVELNSPVPISFLISNQSNEVLEGQLILSEPETGREINLGDVFVGPGSVRRFSSIHALPGWTECLATYTDGSRDFWKRPLPLMTGKDFSEDVNYLLFVDDGGRALQWPVAANSEDSSSEQAATTPPDPSGQSGERFTPRSGFGRSVQPVSVKSWQIPQHPGPLTVAQGMLFSETAKVDMLNDRQWDAIGRWICLGGTVFVHDSSREVIERIKKAVPLHPQPVVLVDEHQTSRCGGGSIREYSGKLFSAEDSEAILTLLEAASRLSRFDIMAVPERFPQIYAGTSNANYTRLLVLAVFSIYLLFSGVVAMLMFRSNRRRVLVYIVSVVSVACLAAAVLGSYLRNSRGDLRWQSVTLGSAGGAVQIAQIQLQSAGGRNTQVAVQGRNADLQLLRKNLRYRRDYYSRYAFFNGRQSTGAIGYPPFSVQPDLLPEEPDVVRIGVPITPWGARESVATDYDSQLQGVQVHLQFRPDETTTNGTTTYSGDSWSYLATGQWTVAVTNTLPFNLSECRLFVITSVPQLQPDTNSFAYSSSARSVEFAAARSVLQIRDLAVSAMETNSMSNVPLVVTTNDYQYVSQESIDVEPSFPGASEIWFAARINQSPMLQIDDQRSDFEQFDGIHFYMQKLTPEEIPQEWLSVCQKWREQQMTEVQEQLKILKNQNPQGP